MRKRMALHVIAAATVFGSFGCKGFMEGLQKAAEAANAQDHLRVVDREISSTRTSKELVSITVKNTSNTITYYDIECSIYDKQTGGEIFKTVLPEPIGPNETKTYVLKIKFAGAQDPEVAWTNAEFRQERADPPPE